YVHNDEVMDRCLLPRDYAESLHVKSYKKKNFGLACICVVDNSDLFEEMKKAYARGYTRYTARDKT
ncbi:MAG: hypothetical protein J5871_02480, partial [Bacteroidales bacterium]|nr:hypothetical protein [Bacteroidales bacterium]